MLALLLVIAIQPVPPVAGRPADFSGAVGGPFVVTARLNSPIITEEDPVTLTLSVVGPGDLSLVKRPDLRFRRDLTDEFVIDDGPERTLAEPAGREFDYTLRPKAAGTKTLSKFKFVYFNPSIKPAARGYQTTYAEPVELHVIPREVFKVELRTRWEVDVEHRLQHEPPIHWLNDQFEGWGFGRPFPETGTGRLPAWLWLLPPTACIGFFTFRRWRREAANDVRAALERLNHDHSVSGRQVAGVIRDFLVARGLISRTTATAAEVEGELYFKDSDRAAMIASLLSRCDAETFGRRTDEGDLIADARALIGDWDSKP